MDDDWRDVLGERFPSFESCDHSDAWARVKDTCTIGDLVGGVVVTCSGFGAWLDIGVGFPALLKIIHIAGLTPETYRAGDWAYPGSRMQAVVVGFDDQLQQIVLSQQSPTYN